MADNNKIEGAADLLINHTAVEAAGGGRFQEQPTVDTLADLAAARATLSMSARAEGTTAEKVAKDAERFSAR